MPVAISQMPMSEDDDDPPNVSSRQINSQQDEPIWNDLQSGGGVQRTARHACKKRLELILGQRGHHSTLEYLCVAIFTYTEFAHIHARWNEVHCMLDGPARVISTFARRASNPDAVCHTVRCPGSSS